MKQRIVWVKSKSKKASARKKQMWRDYQKRDIRTPDIRYEHPKMRAIRRGKKGKNLIIKTEGK